MAHTQTINEATPAGTDAASGGAAQFRDLKRDVRERMDLDHIWASSLDHDGKHEKITLRPADNTVEFSSEATGTTTGSGTSGLMNLAKTLNTSGVVDLIKVTLTNTASGAGSLFLRLIVGASDVLSLSLAGVLTLVGDIVLTANSVIRRNTSDGSDNGSISLAGAGAASSSRGGFVTVFGNENASPGWVLITPGDAGTSRFRITDGVTTFMDVLEVDGSTQQTSTVSGIAWQFTQSHASNPIGIDVNYSGAAPNGTGNFFFRGRDTGATRFELRSNGGLANFSANDVNLSDEGVKEIAGPASAERTHFQQLSFVRARYKDAPETPLDVMLTAQDVQKVYPDLVTEFADGHLGVREHGVVMRGLKVVQEHDEIIETLLRRIEVLEKSLRECRPSNPS